MNRTVKAVIAVAAVGLLLALGLVLRRGHATPPVVVTVRISVTPPEQSGLVAGLAGSARFKYLVGKQAGVQPALAQKVSIKPVPNSALFEAEVRVSTKDEAQRYVAGFTEALQEVCGTQARVALVGQTIH